jgi:hypothetical protein
MARFKNNVLSLENNISGFDCRDDHIEYSECDGTKVSIPHATIIVFYEFLE